MPSETYIRLIVTDNKSAPHTRALPHLPPPLCLPALFVSAVGAYETTVDGLIFKYCRHGPGRPTSATYYCHQHLFVVLCLYLWLLVQKWIVLAVEVIKPRPGKHYHLI